MLVFPFDIVWQKFGNASLRNAKTLKFAKDNLQKEIARMKKEFAKDKKDYLNNLSHFSYFRHFYSFTAYVHIYINIIANIRKKRRKKTKWKESANRLRKAQMFYGF